MKTYKIFLFILLQSFVSVVFSQEIRSGFKIFTEENRTWFKDVNKSDYMGSILNKYGEKIGNPSAIIYSIDKLKKIERELYSEEERNYLLIHYKPMAVFSVRANDGVIVSVSFVFDNLHDPSIIDNNKLQMMQKRIMTELSYKNLLFEGQKAVSGYMLGHVFLFKY